MRISLKKVLKSSLLVVLATLLTVVPIAQAAVSSPAKGKVTFSFDDGRGSDLAKAAPTLKKYGLSGTAYITTGCVGMTKTPNTCHAANDVSYLDWNGVTTLQKTYGWEIGSHSVSHPYMASTNADDGQPNMLTNAQITAELRDSKAALAAHGINATAYASPYGDYNPYVLQEVAKYYTSHRGFADQNDNVYPYNDILLNNMQVQNPVTVAAVKAKIDYAAANNTWVVLTFHGIADRPSTDPNQYQWSTSNLDQIASYVKTKAATGSITPVNASGGLATSTGNLLTGGDFTAGLSSGWRTDQPTIFVGDTASHGSLPNVAGSVALKANTLTKDAHLFSPTVPVNASNMYLIKSYLNLTGISKGEIGYYVDEYDANGNWVSGQYKKHETGVFAENINFTYVPTSVQVKTACLQIYSTAGSKATGYIDSIAMYSVSAGTTTQTNLMKGGEMNTPWADGWTTDNQAAVQADMSGRGAPTGAANSISATLTSGTAHLFSPKIAVDAAKTYYLENYVNIASTSGGSVGIYVDEYDASGTWVSGKYLKWQGNVAAGDVSSTYVPSSTNVKTAQVQFIFEGGTGLKAYIDNSRFWQ